MSAVDVPLDFFLIDLLCLITLVLAFVSVIPTLSVRIENFLVVERHSSRIRIFASRLDDMWSLLFGTPPDRILTRTAIRRILILSTLWCSVFYVYPIDKSHKALQWGFLSLSAFCLSVLGGRLLSRTRIVRDAECGRFAAVVVLAGVWLLDLALIAWTAYRFAYPPGAENTPFAITEFSAGILALEASILGAVVVALARRVRPLAPCFVLVTTVPVAFVIFAVAPGPLAGPVGIPSSAILAAVLLTLEFSRRDTRGDSVEWTLWLLLLLATITVQGSDYLPGVTIIALDIATDFCSVWLTRTLIKHLARGPSVARLATNSAIDAMGIIGFVVIPFLGFYVAVELLQVSAFPFWPEPGNSETLGSAVVTLGATYYGHLTGGVTTDAMVILSLALVSNAALSVANLFVSGLYLVALLVSRFSGGLAWLAPQSRPKVFSMFVVAYFLGTAYLAVSRLVLWPVLTRVFPGFRVWSVAIPVPLLDALGPRYRDLGAFTPLAFWIGTLLLYLFAVRWYDVHARRE